jgi:hypothetical protein
MSNPFRNRSRSAQVALAVFLLVLAAAPATLAATIIGQTDAPATATLDTVAGPHFVAQIGTAGAPSYTAPAPGVITSWSAQLGNGADAGSYELALHTLRPFFASYIDTGQDREVVPLAAAQLETLLTFSARLPVQAGDTIGLWVFGAEGVSGPGVFVNPEAADGDTVGRIDAPEPVLGDQFTIPATFTNSRLLISAVIEPDADNDGFGDETQDKCPASAATQGACPAAPPPPDKTAPAFTVSRSALRLSKKGSISFFVTSNEAATGVAGATVNLGKTAKVVRFKRAKIKLAAGKRTRVTLKLAKKKIPSVRRSLRKKRLTAKVVLTLQDSAGNKRAKTLKLKLRS